MNKEKTKASLQISSCLWFDDQAEEAVDFYTSIFDQGERGRVSYYGKEGKEIHGKSEGSVLTVEFQLAGHSFLALNGGPHFKFNPAVSFFVSCVSVQQMDALWSKLLAGSGEGSVLMPLQAYPFSKRYGWIQDKYGLSWQLMLSEGPDLKQEINPSLLFVGKQVGKALEAMEFYTSIFNNSQIDEVFRYEAAEEPNVEGHVKYAAFTLEGQGF